MGFILVYVTHKDRDSAETVVKHLLQQHLVACANFFPMESMYWWNGSIENSQEIVTILKTQEKLWPRLKEEIENIHPYDVPCIIRLDAQANRAFEEHIEKETGRKR